MFWQHIGFTISGIYMECSMYKIIYKSTLLLPPAYVVRREGNSFTLFVCPHLGGGTRTWHPPPGGGTQTWPPPGGGGGYPDLTPPRGVPGPDTPPRGVPGPDSPGGVPGPDTPPGGTRTWHTPPGGTRTYPPRGGTRTWPPRGVPGPDPPPGGGTQVGQQKEYSLHGGRYASCIHAGGLLV